MSLIPIDVFVEDIEEVVSTLKYDRIEIHRSTDSTNGTDGTYAEISNTTNRPFLDLAVTEYQFIDATGDEDYWYKTRYLKSATGDVSDFSDPISGAGDLVLESILSISELKTDYLFGVNLSDDFGNPYPNSMFRRYIKAGLGRIQAETDLILIPTDFPAEQQDYLMQDFLKWQYVQLDHMPVIKVNSMKLIIAGTQVGETWDETNGLEVRKALGRINVVPSTGFFQQAGIAIPGSWLPTLQSSRQIPLAVVIDYQAGFEKGKVPDEIKHAVALASAIGPLNIAGDLIAGAGIASRSISMDGLSTSVNTTSSATNSGYGARILQYEREIKSLLPAIRKKYHGVGLQAG